jgi:DNA-binding MarR family transcriptional regulator
MSDIKTTIAEQLQQLQMLMHRATFHDFLGTGKVHNPHRGQGRILALLKMKPEISQRELTYLLGMSKQAVAELLSKLEKNGHVTREPSEENKNAMNIKLTEDGRKAADNVDDRTPEAAKIFECLNDEELSLFSEYLGRIIKKYEEQFPDDDYEERRKHMEDFISRYGHGGFGHGEFEHRGFGYGGFGHGGFGHSAFAHGAFGHGGCGRRPK